MIKKPRPKYARYIRNDVLENCRRPQRKDWCAPVTVAEVVQILTGTELSLDTVAETMGWSQETITTGKLGTNSIVKGVQKISQGKIQSRIIPCANEEASWNHIMRHLKNPRKVIYYHEPGHHVLLCGFIEEPLVDPEDIWNHSKVDTATWDNKRKWLLKAEHNVKTPEYIKQGILVPVEFSTVCQNIEQRKNSELVLFYT